MPANSAAASVKPAPPSSPPASAAASPAPGTPIKVGLLESLTGPIAQGAKDNLDGFNVYLASTNNTIAGRKIQVVVADDQNQADVGLTKAKQLVDVDHINVLMGISPTPLCYAIASYVQQAHVPTAVSGNCGADNATTTPKYKSPYFVRFSQNTSGLFGPAGDWAFKQGYKTADIVTSDYAGGLEVTDVTASAFVLAGGSIVQEQHPPLGTTDFGPFLAKLNQNADALFAFMPGADSLRFGQQYADYVTTEKLHIIDDGAQITAGSTLAQLKDKDVGVVASAIYTEASDSPQNKAFLQAWAAKYPGRPVSVDAAQGYCGAQILDAALKKVNGDIENTQAFLNALYSTNLETAKGPVKLDQDHDIIQNVYVYQIVKNGNGYGQKLLQTYKDVARGFERFPGKPTPGALKDKWVGLTKAKLEAMKS